MTLQHKLHDSASTMGVPTTDVSAIVHTAQVRQKRRKAGVAVAAVGLIVTAGVAVRELADVRSNNQELSVSQPIEAPNDSGPASGDAVPPLHASISEDKGEMEIPGASPAVATDPQMQWVAVPANSPQALAARFDNTQRYAISTAPSDAETGEPGPQQLFEYTGGSWSEIPFSMPDELRSVVPSGDYLYAVGTAPAVAGGPLGTLGTYDPSTSSWNMSPVPDSAAGYSSERVTAPADYTVTPIEGGVLLAADVRAGHLNWDAFPDLIARTGEWGTFDWNPDGTVVAYENCDGPAVSEAIDEGNEGAATSTVPGTIAGGADPAVAAHCEKRVYQPAELGLTDADQRALADDGHFGMWRIIGGEATAVELPQPNASGGTLYNGILDLRVDESGYFQYRVEQDGSFTPVFADLATGSCGDYVGNVPLGCFIGGAVATPTGAVTTAEHYLFANNASTGVTNISDMAPLFADVGANPSMYISPSGAVGDVVVGNAEVQYDPPNAVRMDGSVSASGYSLRSTDGGNLEVIDDSTGEPVELYNLSTESGKVDVWVGDEASASPSATSAPATTVMADGSVPEEQYVDGKKITFDVDWQTVSGLNTQHRSLLFTTIDGVHVSVVDPLQVAGLPADTGYNTSFAAVNANQVTADMYLDDGTTMVLIGTPIQ